MKICNKCGIEKEIIAFPKSKGGKDGYQNQCKICKSEADKLYKYKYNRTTRKKNTYKEKEGRVQYEINNKDKIKEYLLLNKDKIRERARIYVENQRKNNPLFQLKHNIRVIIYKSISGNGYKKKSKSENIIGLPYIELKLYLESKFESWMTWVNYGKYNGELNYGWDIDHIVPLSSAITEEELLKLNHYTNLQPLCSKINRHIKSNK